MLAHGALVHDPHYRTLVRIQDVVPLILRRALSCTTPLFIRPRCQIKIASDLYICGTCWNYGIKNRNFTSLHYPCCNIESSIFITDTRDNRMKYPMVNHLFSEIDKKTSREKVLSKQNVSNNSNPNMLQVQHLTGSIP